MTRSILYLTGLLFLFYSCISEKNQAIDKKQDLEKDFYNIDIKGAFSKVEKVNLSGIASDVYYVPLETNPSCILTGVSSLMISGDNIFIRDKKAVYNFNTDGRFIKQIGEIGSGPGEYGQVFYFTLIEELNEIFLYCYPSGKIKVYDIESGNYKRSFKIESNGLIEFPAANIASFIPNVPQYGSESVSEELIIFTPQGNKIGSIPNSRLPNIKRGISGLSRYYLKDSILCYMHTTQDTLSILTESLIKKPYVSFRLDNPYKVNEIVLELKIGEIQYPDFLSINNVLETHDYFFIVIKKGVGLYVEHESHNFIYNKKSDHLIKCQELVNDIDQGLSVWPDFIINDSLFIDIQLPHQMINSFQSADTGKQRPENYISLINSLSEDDNPVLVFVKK